MDTPTNTAPFGEVLTHDIIAEVAQRIVQRIEDANHYFICDADKEEAVDIVRDEIAALAQREATR
ncbi:hypothetical protein [Methylobacterium fujisawaense]|uniref:hypothetical protein n=1 Tax=Methylobacterium fujisawaense TaxID=107400 RepID=UPI00313DA14E